MSVLRASGDRFDPNRFLEQSTLKPCNVFMKGERRSETSVWNSSGITVPTIDAEIENLPKQIQDSIDFLKLHRDELKHLKQFEGIDDMRIDFGVERKTVFAQSHFLPADLVTLAGEIGIGLEISVYGSDE